MFFAAFFYSSKVRLREIAIKHTSYENSSESLCMIVNLTTSYNTIFSN